MGLNNIIHPHHRCHQNYSNSNGLAQLEPLQLSSSVESTSTTDSIVGSISSEVANLALSHQTTPSHTKVDTPTAINIERNRPRRPPLQHYKEAPARILLPSSITPSLAPAHSFVSETRGPHPTHSIAPPLDSTEQNSLLALICSSTASRSLTGQPPWTALVWTTPHVLWHGHSALYGSNAQTSCGERGTQSCTTLRIIYSD